MLQLAPFPIIDILTFGFGAIVKRTKLNVFMEEA